MLLLLLAASRPHRVLYTISPRLSSPDVAPVATGVGLAAASPPHAVAVGGRPRLGVAGRLGAVPALAHRPIRRRKVLPIDQQGTPNRMHHHVRQRAVTVPPAGVMDRLQQLP